MIIGAASVPRTIKYKVPGRKESNSERQRQNHDQHAIVVPRGVRGEKEVHHIEEGIVLSHSHSRSKPPRVSRKILTRKRASPREMGFTKCLRSSDQKTRRQTTLPRASTCTHIACGGRYLGGNTRPRNGLENDSSTSSVKTHTCACSP